MLCLFRSFILFPAYAGVIPIKDMAQSVSATFPCTCGGDPFRSMMDYFTQDKIATLTAENQNLKFAASQDRQNALLTTVMSQQTDTILNRVNPRPIPAYQVANPNVGVNCCGCC